MRGALPRSRFRPIRKRLLRLIRAARRVDEIAQHRFGRFHVACEQAFDSLFQKLLPEGRVALGPCLNRFPEIPRDWHRSFSLNRRRIVVMIAVKVADGRIHEQEGAEYMQCVSLFCEAA